MAPPPPPPCPTGRASRDVPEQQASSASSLLSLCAGKSVAVVDGACKLRAPVSCLWNVGGNGSALVEFDWVKGGGGVGGGNSDREPMNERGTGGGMHLERLTV